jgi:hypothetical protein
VNSKQEYSEEHQLPSEANPNETSSSDENLSNNSTVPPKKKNKRGKEKRMIFLKMLTTPQMKKIQN